MVALLLLLGRAEAIQVEAHDVPCPVGSGTARVYRKVSADTLGGFDSDLASYASGGGQWRAYQIATCDDNLLTLYANDLAEAGTADRAKLAAALESSVAKVADRKAPEVWERYRIAAALYAAMGRDDRFLGDLFVQASWTARDAAVGFYAGLHGPVEARALIDQGWAELKKPLSIEDRKKVLYNLARIAHRGGWGTERDAMLAAFEAVAPPTEKEREALARFRHFAIDVEPALQDEAITHYIAVLRTDLPHDEKVRVSYVLADLLRRRGRDREAVAPYFLVANDKEAPDELRGMALYLVGPIVERLDPVTRKAVGGGAAVPP
jgi:hypothetical protein